MKTAIVLSTLMLAGGALGMTSHAASTPPSSADQVHPILIGAEVPEVTVRGTDGSEVDLASKVRSKPSIVIFYRGGW